MKMAVFKWGLLCWLTACLLALAPLADRALHSGSYFLLPNTFSDSLLYRVIIQKAAQPGPVGDPFLWEHRHDPQSLLNLVRFWPSVYARVYERGGDVALLAFSTILSGVWFFALFRFARRLGMPVTFAFFVAGIQAFFVVNLAYQVVGFKTNFRAYSFWITEHMRLYPSVTAMAWYSVAAVTVAWAVDDGRRLRLALAGALVALTTQGRPFDWLVLMGALVLLFAYSIVWKRGADARRVLVVLAVALILSIGFILEFSFFMHAFRAEYEDQIARGNLQVKLLAHYVKYSLAVIFCVLGIGGLSALLQLKNGVERGDSRDRALLWLCCLAMSSLLVHYKSLLEGGVTLVGFAYPMVFSVFPWFFLLAMTALVRGLDRASRLAWLRHSFWPAALLAMLVFQQIGILAKLRGQCPSLVVSTGRLAVYRQILQAGKPDAVVLTLGRGLEVSTFANGRLFFPNPAPATYICSAPTTELLERFCAAKLLLTGTLDDLSPIFSPEGVEDFEGWRTTRPLVTRFWIDLLEQALGHNTFIFHPIRNRGELAHRGIQLPLRLRERGDFIAFFPQEFRRVFDRYTGRTVSSTDTGAGRFRLDCVYVPSAAMEHVDLNRMGSLPFLREEALPKGADGRLWSVVCGKDGD